MGPKVERRRRRLAQQIAAEPSGFGQLTKGEFLGMLTFALKVLREPQGAIAEHTRHASLAAQWWAAWEAANRELAVVIPDDDER